jgi:hypothetical protein
MMKIKKMLLLGAALSAAVLSAHADEPGRHPYYVHALNDLATAKFLVEHRRPEDGAIGNHETVMTEEINAAFGEIRAAMKNDGKGMDPQMGHDQIADASGRIHQALDLLKKAHDDVAHEEDDPASKGLQVRALKHIDAAMWNAQQVIADVGRR